jgi:hypothetical protein
MATYTIVFSNYTMRLFAWLGTPAANRRFLGNRSVLGSAEASSPDDAMAAWLQRELQDSDLAQAQARTRAQSQAQARGQAREQARPSIGDDATALALACREQRPCD